MTKPKAASQKAPRSGRAADVELAPPLLKNRKLRWYLFALILLGLAIYFFLSRFVVMEQSLRAISTLRVSYVILAFVAEAFSYLGSGYLLRKTVSLAGKSLPVIEGALMTAGANSVGTLGGGAIGTAGMTYHWLRGRGTNPGAAGLGGWLPIILENLALAVASLVGLLVLIHLKKSPRLFEAGFAFAVLILAIFIAALIWSWTHRERMGLVATAIANFAGKFRRRSYDPSKIKAAVDQFLEGWDTLLLGGWHGPALGAILNTGFDMLTLDFLFLAAGYRVNPAVLVAGYGVPQLLGKSTVILGGVGVVEATMIGLFTILGVPRSSAILVVLAYRLVSFWLPTLIGIPLVPYLGRRTASLGQDGRSVATGS